MSALTTFKKELRKCPICEHQFQEEFMLTGSMRQVSLNMNEELRTFYKDYQGQPVVPFAYETLVCPKCYYASLNTDFNAIYPIKQIYTEKEKELINNIRVNVLKTKAQRVSAISMLTDVNFESQRNLETALASYILTIECYAFFYEKFIPDTKRAVCSLRAAWLAGDIKREDLQLKYYKEAYKYYTLITSRPDDSNTFKLGPDWGNNFGFEGARFIKALLDLKFIDELDDLNKKYELLQNVRATFSKIRGLGKASQNKRGPLLKIAEDMFERVQPVYELIKSKVESGDYKASVKSAISLTATQPTKDIKSTAASKNADDDTDDDNTDNTETQNNAGNAADTSSELDKQIKNAAIDIVKFAMQSTIKRDSVKDIEKILRKHFSQN